MKPLNKIIPIIILFVFLFPALAQSADRYVTESGSDAANDCTISTSPCATINRAVNQADHGDTVKIAQGTYHESFGLFSDINLLTIQGGWNANFSQRNENPALTIVDGNDTDRVFIISNMSTDVTMEGLTLTGGYHASSGGGIYAISSNETISLTLNNLILESNNGVNYGGAVYVNAAQSGNMILTVENCIIRNNDSYHGAGIFVSSSSDGMATATIKNSFISDNSSSYNGGGLYVGANGGDAEVDLICNTITNNTSPASLEFGGAVWLESSSGSGETVYSSIVNSKNNIIWGNSYNDIFIQAQDAVSIAQVNSEYSDIGNVEAIDTGVHNDDLTNINSDPLFMNASAGNYHLKGGSPCIGTGVYFKRVWIPNPPDPGWSLTDYGVPNEDFDGDSRNSDWVQVSSSTQYKYCDIGADEYTSSTNPGILLLLLNQLTF